MMKIKTIVIDDEPLAVDELCRMLKSYNEITVVDSAETVSEALKKLNILILI